MTAPTTCEDVREMSGELALGVATGRERADAIVHLATCAACNELVADLAQSADGLLLLGPEADPSAGFEEAALQRRRAPERPPARRARRSVLVAAAVALVLAIGAAVFVVAGSGGHSVGTRSATMVSSKGNVGFAVLSGRERVVLLLPEWHRLEPEDDGDEYRLHAQLDSGRTVDLGPVQLSGPNSAWSGDAGFDVRSVQSVAMVEADGTVVCSATF